MMHKFIRQLLITCLLSAAAMPMAVAQWTLNNAHSKLSFVTIKAGNIGETHHFKKLSGIVTSQGALTVDIHLGSVETLIPIRNERMQQLLFDIANFPTASITAALDAQALADLAVGSATQLTISGSLQLKETTQPISVEVLAARLNDNTLLVSTTAPILVNAATVGLTDGVEALREIAGLPSISHVVPVSFVLTFNTRGQ